jgi:hypothetical protein
VQCSIAPGASIVAEAPPSLCFEKPIVKGYSGRHGHIAARGRISFCNFTDDHEPAHLHVIGDGQAKANLTGPGGPAELVWTDAVKLNDLRRVLTIINERRDFLLERWRQIHG